MLDFLQPNWPAPSNVRAVTTTRAGGVSKPPYDGNNLALHVGDQEACVLRNRELLIEALKLPASPEWLEQTHTNHCVVIEEEVNRVADASLTRKPNTVLAIMTADCLPIVICNTQGTEVAAIHAGWRGLANGIIESTLSKMQSSPHDLLAWIGPAICQQCYETGEEVQRTFIHQYPFTRAGFRVNNHRVYADLPGIAELILHNLGVNSVYQSNQCTFESNTTNFSKNKFYSYRHEKQTGRMVTLIWFK